MSDDLFLAILAMDAYNRGYSAGVNMTGGQIGNATVGVADGDSIAQAASFFAQSYILANGQTVISYRGTDNTSFFNPGSDIWNGWITGAGVYGSAQAEMAAQFYQSVNGGSKRSPDERSDIRG